MKAKQTFRGVVIRGASTARAAPSAIRTATQAGIAPRQARVRVSREVAGRGGKGVTVISGLPLGPEDLEALAARLKKRCGAGGAVKDGTIEIQGEHRDRLVAELQELGYEPKRSGG